MKCLKLILACYFILLSSVTSAAERYKLFVETDPPDSIVRIMNITEKYTPGIQLTSNKYDINIEKKGYKSYRKLIKIDDDITLQVNLIKKDNTGNSSCSIVKHHENVKIFHWNSSGESYVTIHSPIVINPVTLFPENLNLSFLPVSVNPPIPTPEKIISKSYRVAQSTTVETPLVKSNKKIIYIIGESHIGDSQKIVAKVITELINEKEIDAILVEQPDNLKLNWNHFRILENNPDLSIANLQNKLLSEADNYEALSDNVQNELEKIEEERKKLLNSKKYKTYSPYFIKMENASEENITNMLMQIYSKHGEKGVKEAAELLGELHKFSEKISTIDKNENVASLHQFSSGYKDSKYFSATDYLFIMLNLKNIKIPFYFIEDIKERNQFENDFLGKGSDIPKSALLGRDRVMVHKTKKIMNKNGYRQAILVCGAHHTDNLLKLFSKNGYETKISYQIESNDFKPEIVSAKHPNLIIDWATESTTVRRLNQEYIVENIPSKELQLTISNLLEKTELSIDNTMIPNIQEKFFAEYQKKNLKSETQWDVTIPTNNGTIIFSKSADKNSINITVNTPADNIPIQNLDSNHIAVMSPNQKKAYYEKMRTEFETGFDWVISNDPKSNTFLLCCQGPNKEILEATNISVLIEILASTRVSKEKGGRISLHGFGESDIDALSRNTSLRNLHENSDDFLLASGGGGGKNTGGGGGGKNTGGGGGKYYFLTFNGRLGSIRKINNTNVTTEIGYDLRNVDYIKPNWEDSIVKELSSNDQELHYELVLPVKEKANKSEIVMKVQALFTKISKFLSIDEKKNKMVRALTNIAKKSKKEEMSLNIDSFNKIADDLAKEIEAEIEPTDINILFERRLPGGSISGQQDRNWYYASI